MLTEYIDEALSRARYEIIDDQETPYYGEIPDLPGVWASAATLERMSPRAEGYGGGRKTPQREALSAHTATRRRRDRPRAMAKFIGWAKPQRDHPRRSFDEAMNARIPLTRHTGHETGRAEARPTRRLASIEHMADQPIRQLGLEPGGLGRHHLADVGHRHEVGHARWGRARRRPASRRDPPGWSGPPGRGCRRRSRCGRPAWDRRCRAWARSGCPGAG